MGPDRKIFDESKREDPQQLKKQQQDAARNAPGPSVQPVAARISPPMASLPPLAEDKMVDAIDLANKRITLEQIKSRPIH